MPKPILKEPARTLEMNIIQTLLDGLHRWRPDLHYPESHSDMQAAVRELMALYDITEKPKPLSDKEIRQRIADNYFNEEYD
jgi:hypothetical protein